MISHIHMYFIEHIVIENILKYVQLTSIFHGKVNHQLVHLYVLKNSFRNESWNAICKQYSEQPVKRREDGAKQQAVEKIFV